MTDNRTTELLDGLRNVGNLHEFAELFGFDWHDDSDWTWHDVAVKMADELEQAIAATLGNRPTKSGRGYYTDRDGEGTHIMCDDCGGYIGTAEEIAATLGSEPPYDELLRCLENDWHISASWDGLRKFWCIELTDEGVRMRDAHDEALRRIAALEELVWFMVPFFDSACSHECGCPDDYYFDPYGCDDGCKALKELNERMKELGIEVD